MYELATFLPKRGPKRLVVLPTFLIRCTIVAVPCFKPLTHVFYTAPGMGL